jgi:hypothetical protein
VQFFMQRIKDGVFEPTDLMADGARNMLSELYRWATALRTMRG